MRLPIPLYHRIINTIPCSKVVHGLYPVKKGLKPATISKGCPPEPWPFAGQLLLYSKVRNVSLENRVRGSTLIPDE